MPKISGERERIKNIIGPIVSTMPKKFKINKTLCSLLLGVEGNDDCAIFDVGDVSIVIGMDFVRGTGFRAFEIGLMDYYDVGYYLIIANVSDIAAMGAQPIALTTVVRYKKDVTDEDFTAIFRGMNDAAKIYGAAIIGGDIGSYSENVFAATSFGITEKGNYLLRGGAKAGDLLCVTGPIGVPAASRLYFEEAKKRGFVLKNNEEKLLADSWKRPKARIKEGLLLTRNKLGHSCQDISDGLKETIVQTSQLSKCAFLVYEDKLPVSDVVKKVAGFFNINPSYLAMGPSVDFELMFTIAKNDLQKCKEIFEKNGCRLHVIGEAVRGGDNKMVTAAGEKIGLPGSTWDQKTDLDSMIKTFT